MDFKKMSFWSVFLAILVTSFLGGCSGLSDNLITTVTDEFGNVTETVAGASIAKEQIVHGTLKADVDGYYTALGDSGSKMGVDGYQEIVLKDGSKAYLPLMTASFKEAPKRNANLPTAPSEHPVWRFGEKVVDGALSYGLAFLLNDFGKEALGGAQTKYYGDYNYNPQTATPFIVDPVVVQ